MSAAAGEKLPLWRLILGVGVLAAMAAVLIALGPVYFEDFHLRQYLKAVASDPLVSGKPDDAIRAAVLARSRELDLPVRAEDVQILHPNGKLQVQLKYAVQMDFPLYQVDLHFHPGATGR